MERSLPRRIASFAHTYFLGLGASAYLLTFGFWSSRHRDTLARLPRMVGFGLQRPVPQLPSIEQREAFLAIGIELREIYGIDGNVSVTELALLASLVKQQQPRTIFEIGTFDGRTTLNLAANAPFATVHTLDLPPTQVTALPIKPGDEHYIEKPASGARYRGTDCAARIVQHYGDSATFDFSSFYSGVDFVFVDGAHSRDYVLSDSRHALKLLRGGRGIIAWHDYGTTDVTEAIDSLYHAGGSFTGLKRVDGTALAILMLG